VFLAMLISAVQSIFFSHLLFEDMGALKATFRDDFHQVEVQAMSQFAGGLFLVIGTMLSGVKWNPINGKLAGIGCFLCAANAAFIGSKADGSGLLLFVYAAEISMGGLHIFAFPSNPPTPKTDKTKNNHGNTSDLVMFVLVAAAVQAIFYPDLLTHDLHSRVRATFTTPSQELNVMVSFCGGLLLVIGTMLSSVKWNPINGKMAGIGCFLAVLNSVVIFSHKASYGSGTYFLIHAIILIIPGVHIFAFPSNELPPKTEKHE
jgi:hypothetical protein